MTPRKERPISRWISCVRPEAAALLRRLRTLGIGRMALLSGDRPENVEALGAANVLGLSLPSAISSAHSREDAQTLAANLGIRYETVHIREVVAETETKKVSPPPFPRPSKRPGGR